MEEDAPEDIQLKRRVLSVLKNVWEEYYQWEPESCSRVLSSLSVATPVRPNPLLALDTDASTALQEAGLTAPAPLESNSSDSDMKLYSLEDEQWSCSPVYPETATDVSPPSPHPAYESCAPLYQNILHGDDSNFMPFFPHADEPSFDGEDHALEYKALAWQEPYRDSDTLEIVLETARRLNVNDELSPVQIDRIGVLPLMLRTTSVWGTIWTGNHSDPIVWPGSSRSSCSLPDISAPSSESLRTRLQDHLTLWCPSPGCTQAHCFSHNVEQFDIASDVSTSTFRCLPPLRSCGQECTIEQGAASEGDVSWSDQDVDDLRVLSHLGTLMTPCELAQLCRKPCYEVALMCKKNNDFVVPAKRSRGRPRLDIVKRPAFGPERAPEFVPNQPCIHPGPCSQSSDCACYLNKAHCSRHCRCSRSCPRRWQGCKCAEYAVKTPGNALKSKASKSCMGKYCPCWAANRECDPEVCSSCDTDECRNSHIQRGVHKHTTVKTGKFGLGLFVLEDVEEGDLITEYLGELIYEPTFFCRAQVTSHVGRSYVFGLNKLMSVDAFPAGNDARFINHAPTGSANVAVSIMLVYGEQRIGVFAKRDICAGSELFMDYGPEYPIEPAEGAT